MNFAQMPKDELRILAKKASALGVLARNGAKRKTHCIHGHPLSGPNLILRKARIKSSGKYYKHVRHLCNECVQISKMKYADRKMRGLV
jgi:hypothetical protein